MQGETLITIPEQHPAFAGHFPGHPIVPGVVLLDEALHAISSALQRPLEQYEIASAKFLAVVGPGEQLRISFELKPNGTLRFDIEGGGRKVATGALTLHGNGGNVA